MSETEIEQFVPLAQAHWRKVYKPLNKLYTDPEPFSVTRRRFEQLITRLGISETFSDSNIDPPHARTNGGGQQLKFRRYFSPHACPPYFAWRA